MGTVAYMSPEQVRAKELDGRSDLFSFGTVLYEMATGKLPFEGSSPRRNLRRYPAPATASGDRAVNPQLPLVVDAVIAKALEKDRDLRYQDAGEISADLVRLKRNSESNLAAASLTTSRSRVSMPGLLAAAGVFALALAFAAGLGTGKLRQWLRPSLGGTRIQSLAVLPLENLSGDPAQEYFADGMTEELITDLSQIEAIRVISRTSAMRYKGSNKSLPDIARELNVDALVEGSVQRSGNRVRITAQLIYAPTDRHLWADSYERNLQDVLSLQDDVARDIADNIKVHLTPTEKARLSTSSSVNPQAYQSFLEGRYYWSMRTEDGINQGIKSFQKAIQEDPHYAQAYAGLADSYFALAGYRIRPGREVYPLAKAAALKALEIDEELAEAHTPLAAILAENDFDLNAAEKEIRRAIELNPNYATAHQWYAEVILVPLGRREEAIGEMERAQQLDPLSLAINTDFGYVLYLEREPDRAIIQLQKTLAMYKSFPAPHLYLARAYLQKKMVAEAMQELRTAADLSGGHPFYRAWLGYGYAVSGESREALRIVDELTKIAGGKYVSSYDMAAIFMGLRRKDQAVTLLQKAYEERASHFHHLGVEPIFDPLRSDSRFQALVREIGLPESNR